MCECVSHLSELIKWFAETGWEDVTLQLKPAEQVLALHYTRGSWGGDLAPRSSAICLRGSHGTSSDLCVRSLCHRDVKCYCWSSAYLSVSLTKTQRLKGRQRAAAVVPLSLNKLCLTRSQKNLRLTAFNNPYGHENASLLQTYTISDQI